MRMEVRRDCRARRADPSHPHTESAQREETAATQLPGRTRGLSVHTVHGPICPGPRARQDPRPWLSSTAASTVGEAGPWAQLPSTTATAAVLNAGQAPSLAGWIRHGNEEPQCSLGVLLISFPCQEGPVAPAPLCQLAAQPCPCPRAVLRASTNAPRHPGVQALEQCWCLTRTAVSPQHSTGHHADRSCLLPSSSSHLACPNHPCTGWGPSHSDPKPVPIPGVTGGKDPLARLSCLQTWRCTAGCVARCHRGPVLPRAARGGCRPWGRCSIGRAGTPRPCLEVERGCPAAGEVPGHVGLAATAAAMRLITSN